MAQELGTIRTPPQTGQWGGEEKVLSLRQRISISLSRPVDIAGLVYFRIAFYSLMCWEAWRFLAGNWVGLNFVGKEFYFTYWPLTFVQPWPGNGMYIHLYVMAAVAFGLVLGLFYRVLATLFFLLFTYLFLLEKALYLNHFYLGCLLSFLMIFVPAHRAYALDAWRNPSWRTRTIPAWPIWLLRFQVGVPYFFGGIAKLNLDWLRGEPLRLWLSTERDFPLLGPLFAHEGVVWLMVYGSLVFDLSVVFFLLNRRTRVFAYIAALLFHFLNSRLFVIGVFPWMMIAATALFFEPDWPRRVLNDFQENHPYRVWALIVGFVLGFLLGWLLGHFSWVPATVAGLGVAIAAYHLDEPFGRAQEGNAGHDTKTAKARTTVKRGVRQGKTSRQILPVSQWTFLLLGLWATVQVLLPLRHFLISGNVNWTEEGHNFSWHMMLREKEGEGTFIASDPATGEQWNVNLWDYLTLDQRRQMLIRPHMIIQFAHYLAGRLRGAGHKEVEIRARISASLNGRAPQLLIDPDVDLTKVPYPWWGHAPWILPLDPALDLSDRERTPAIVR
jgi:vitamin K-dependent gamma-carboxylase-like protein